MFNIAPKHLDLRCVLLLPEELEAKTRLESGINLLHFAFTICGFFRDGFDAQSACFELFLLDAAGDPGRRG